MNELAQEIKQLIKASGKPIAQICKEAEVKPRWLYRFLAGDFKDPGFTKIQRLYRALEK
jgi:transcriptional regulator with XRE-family HTH domain